MIDDPLKIFRRWYADAERRGISSPEAMALATAAPGGAPSVRIVLLKQADEHGFVFFTDARSRKGRELADNPRAAAAFHWQPPGHQVRIEGRVERISAADEDAYWETRPRGSRLSAASSHQSHELGSREQLTARRALLAERWAGRPIPRPAQWGGFRIVPDAIEFWTYRANRLHHRELFRRSARGWRRALLQP